MDKNTLIIADGTTTLEDVRQHITDVVIPLSVTKIRHDAFAGCISLTKITIPKGVTSIGEWAFAGCISLTEITIPEGVTYIGEGAFFNCSSLKAIYIDKEKDTLDISKTNIPEICKVYWKGEF